MRYTLIIVIFMLAACGKQESFINASTPKPVPTPASQAKANYNKCPFDWLMSNNGWGDCICIPPYMAPPMVCGKY